MIPLFQPITHLFKLKKVSIDNNVFCLHYKATVIILCVFSLLVTAQQYFGNPIDCMHSKDAQKDGLNSYCWIFSTFSTKQSIGVVGTNLAYYGVGTHYASKETVGLEDHHKYYQWVSFVLIIQALLFYTPHYLWKNWENARIYMLTEDLCGPVLKSNTWTKERCLQMIMYLSRMNENPHTVYAIRFFCCEILNFINVVGQIFFVDYFLGGKFLNYGPAAAVLFENTNGTDHVAKVFPKVAKCTYYDFGPSGTVQHKDVLCVLPLNVVNEKLYAFLWFWFMGLALASTVALLYRIVVFSCSEVRVWVLMAQANTIVRKDVRLLVNSTNIGDWFIWQQLNMNLNPEVFHEVVSILCEEVKTKSIII